MKKNIESAPVFKKEQREKKEITKFRELAPEEFWGGYVSLDGISQNDFSEKIKETAKEIDFTYSGYITEEEYYFSRYPRRAFGPVAPVEKYQEALRTLSEKLGSKSKEETKSKELKFRVLLGLEEGYLEHKKKQFFEEIEKEEIVELEEIKEKVQKLIGQSTEVIELREKIKNAESIEDIKDILNSENLSKNHTIEEVKSELGDSFILKEASIYTAGPWGEYKEPAVVIEGDSKRIHDVYNLAEKFKQERIAVENLKEGKSYMVETKYCENPDQE